MFLIVAPASSAFWKLFGGYNNYNGYPEYGQHNYGSYNPQPKPRYNYGRSHSEGGESRYKAICRVHAAGTEGFPGVGNPICPY